MTKEDSHRWKLLFEQTPLGIIEWDLQWRVVSWNSSAEKIFGWTAAEMMGVHYERIVPTSAQALVKRVTSQITAQAGGQRSSNNNVTKDGRVIDCEWYNTTLVDDKGKTIGAASVVQDVTDQLAAQRRVLSYSLRLSDINTRLLKLSRSRSFDGANLETALREISEVAARGLNVASASVWQFLPDQGTAVCIDSFRLEGEKHVAGESLILSEFPRFFKALDDELMIVAHAAQLDPRTSEFNEHYLYPRQITSKLSVATRLRGEIAGMLCLEHSGVPREWSPEEQVFAGAIADLISLALESRERQKAEAEQKKLEAQLFQSQKMEALGTLAGGIAHDFNNILSAILGSAELALIKTTQGQNAAEQLQTINVSALRARDIVQQILSFSRKQGVDLKPVDLREAVENSMRLIRSTFPATIEFSVELHAPDPVILSDAGQIHQLLLNLCSNAMRACAGYIGTIAVQLSPITFDKKSVLPNPALALGNYLLLSIADNGCGIESEAMKNIFDPFYTTREPGEGTGLGLSIVHTIMANHRGTVTVQSEAGRGCQFNLYFPIAPGYTAQFCRNQDRSLSFGNDEVILLIDDDPQVLKSGSDLLLYLGYEVRAFTRPADALSAFMADPELFSLVITDLTMPQTTGIDVAQQIREMRSDLPVILTSGFGSQIDIRAGDVHELLPKPFLLYTLSKAVQGALDSIKRS